MVRRDITTRGRLPSPAAIAAALNSAGDRRRRVTQLTAMAIRTPMMGETKIVKKPSTAE